MCIASLSGVVLLALLSVAIGVGSSPSMQEYFRGCEFCERINCVEVSWFTNEPWFRCDIAQLKSSGGCLMTAAGQCSLQANATTVIATCNMQDMPVYSRSCHLGETGCASSRLELDDASSSSNLCKTLCSC